MTRLRVVPILLIAIGPLTAGRDTVVFPTGTTLPIRFVQTIKSGRDSVGARVAVQTLGPLVHNGCVVVAPYTQVVARVTVSRGGHLFGGRGTLALRFDSLETLPDRWIAITGVLATLEYAREGDLTETGVLYASRGSFVKRATPLGLAGAVGLDPAPLAVLSGYWLARRGPPARIVAGEVGELRLTAPLELRRATSCTPAGARRSTVAIPALPSFPARTEGRGGKVPADPVNLIFLGAAADLSAAFEHAGWIGPERGSFGTVSHEIVAGLANHQAIGAPLSSQYLDGRRQDLAYELSGPNARWRHHVRIWLRDTLALVWVGAADQDVGVKFNPFIGRFTHRISPGIDDERDLIVRELEATGCADLLDYVAVPGAVRAGRNASNQSFVTDGRAAVILVRSCARARGMAVRQP
jgi:hypothetical protein